MSTANTRGLDNVKDQIGCCGIWCGSCVVGNGVLKLLTERYEGMITAYGLKEWAPGDFDYEEFSKGLASIRAVPLCSGCLRGGGRPDCEMRSCASRKKVPDCSECAERPGCQHDALLEKMRSGAVAAGLFVKSGSADAGELIDEWTVELKRKWPSITLFMNDK